ncbi:uncharacterized protein LOC125666064 isoform X1 [Ostrea edulis]|uniref:uncharacterized protein LOC125666064 isoform X1 n=1 Tax=Ostrea edulis TaxID=37623 RepID=UPI00209542CE|nr:uncharacterized protein LOC125666064 isoform X1 [Ostrea edulis]
MKSLVILLTLLNTLFYISAQSTCKKVNSCKCKFDNGDVIDLSPVAKSDGAAFNDVLDSSGLDTFSWNPCTSFSEGACTNAAVCQTHADLQYNCGTQESAVFGYDDTEQVYTLTYQADTVTKSNDLRITTLFLFCQQGPDVFEPTGETGQATYNLSFKSKYSCPRSDAGLSAGTILIIIFVAMIPVYLIGGVLFQVFVRKNSGMKVIPNYNFWVGLPGLIKDGMLFIIRGGRKKGTYNSI